MSLAPLPSLHVTPERVREVQDERVRAQVALLERRHPRYRKAWRDAGVDPATVRSVADLEALPTTSKRDLAGDPHSFRLDPDPDPAAPPDVLWDVVYTTGSTGPPTPLFHTARDFRSIMLSQRRMGEIRGIGVGDRIANLFPVPGHPHGSFVRVTNAAQAVGASLITAMSGAPADEYSVTRRTHEVADLLVAAQPTVLWGVPSYLRRLLEHLADTGRRLTDVRIVVGSGEGIASAAEAHLLRLVWSLGSPGAIVSPGFGASELGCSLVPCEPGAPLHNPAPELNLLQVVGDDGRVLDQGTPGRLCITHLDRRGTALVRYLIGDLVTLTEQPCPACGRAGGSLVAHHGRADGMVKVRGNLVDPQRLALAVDDVPGVADHRCVLRRGTSEVPDELVVEVALDDNALPEAVTDVLAQVGDAVRVAVGVRPTVRARTAAELAIGEGEIKRRRFVVEEPA